LQFTDPKGNEVNEKCARFGKDGIPNVILSPEPSEESEGPEKGHAGTGEDAACLNMSVEECIREHLTRFGAAAAARAESDIRGWVDVARHDLCFTRGDLVQMEESEVANRWRWPRRLARAGQPPEINST
jgi:hypothetical protein